MKVGSLPCPEPQLLAPGNFLHLASYFVKIIIDASLGSEERK